MNRIQKKCFVFSIGMHGLLLVILLGSAAFRNRTEETNVPILSLIPANIIDAAGAGGGQPSPANPVVQVQPAVPPQVQPAPRPRPEPQVSEPQPVQKVEHQKSQEPEVETHATVSAETSPTRPAKTHHQHEIHPTFTPVGKTASKTTRTKSDTSETAALSSAHSNNHRLKEIENSLDHLASGVQTSGAGKTVVDVEGIGGGGEVFAGYNTAIYNIYHQAWIAPENGANPSTVSEARIVVARDGSIISADLVGPSGERSLDKSVIRVLGAVTKLPPFPASAHDEQRSFRIQFGLTPKEASG